MFEEACARFADRPTFTAIGQTVTFAEIDRLSRDIGGMIEIMKAWPFTALAGVNTLFVGLMQHPDFDAVDFSHALDGSKNRR